MPAPFTWTGCYVGGHVGYGWGNEQWNYGFYGGTDFNQYWGSHTTSGVLGGAQVGCNYQMGVWVLGLEGDFSWTGMSGSHSFNGYFQSTTIDWIATATGRVGYAMGSSLIYVKGGVAVDRGNYNMLLVINHTDTVIRTGWTIGAGWEYAMSPNWSIRLEYNYMDFGKFDVWWNFLNASPVDPWSFHLNQTIQDVKLGFNFRY